MKTLATYFLLFVVLVALGGWFTRPAPLRAMTERVTVGDDPERYLQLREADAAANHGIVDGAEKRIRWASQAGSRTDYVVIYLHGFSASRGEIAPVPEQLADALGANLFETRLTGHGRLRQRLENFAAEAWLEDGAEALAIGRSLGDRLIVIGVSTGATVALAMAEHPDFSAIDSLLLVSPNWEPAAGGVDIATGPYGPQLAKLIVGKTRSWEAANDGQEQYWTTSYPTAAVIEVMRLVKLGNELTERAEVPNALLIYSPKDDVISVPKALEGFDRLPARRKEVLRVDEPDSLSPHVLTGDILAPAETAATVAAMEAFIRRAS